jgi:hypothetical protein
MPQRITDHATHDGTLYRNTSQTMQHTMAHYTATHRRPCNTVSHTISQHSTDHSTQYHTLYRNIAQTIQHSITHYIAHYHRPCNTLSHTIQQALTTIPCNSSDLLLNTNALEIACFATCPFKMLYFIK